MNLFEIRQRMLMNLDAFPSEPSSYLLLDTYNSSGTFTAPAKGWFRIELQGASGNGEEYKFCTKEDKRVVGDTTTGESYEEITYTYYYVGGGGGGGGGCAISDVKLKKGDTVTFNIGGVGSASKATITSSLESYSPLNVTPAHNGSKSSSPAISGNTPVGGPGGVGGVGSGGNFNNFTGKTGERGDIAVQDTEKLFPASGGAAGYLGGNAGGNGAGVEKNGTVVAAVNGSKGFVKIYRGN